MFLFLDFGAFAILSRFFALVRIEDVFQFLPTCGARHITLPFAAKRWG